MVRKSTNQNADTVGKTPSKSDNDVKKARIKMWQAIVVAAITTIGGGIFGYAIKKTGSETANKQLSVSVPINNTVTIVDKLPDENNAEDYMLLKDISIFDLRQWRFTPDSCLNKRYSPANYTNYLHVKKTKPLDKIVIHYATSGYAIDMRCITHAYTVEQRKKPIEHAGEKVKEYAMTVDVSNVDIGKEFLIVVEATYWNGFNDVNKNDASTYTDEEINGLNELGLIVFFPDRKPFKQTTKIDRDTRTDAQHEYRGIDEFYADASRKFIYWDIRERSPNHHYKLEWTW
jgi:hypothetical protein